MVPGARELHERYPMAVNGGRCEAARAEVPENPFECLDWRVGERSVTRSSGGDGSARILPRNRWNLWISRPPTIQRFRE